MLDQHVRIYIKSYIRLCIWAKKINVYRAVLRVGVGWHLRPTLHSHINTIINTRSNIIVHIILGLYFSFEWPDSMRTYETPKPRKKK